MMKPEDYIEEKQLPTKEEVALEKANKLEDIAFLRENIKDTSRSHFIVHCTLPFLFTLNVIVDLVTADSIKPYFYPLALVFLLCALVFGYYAFIYYRIRKATTSQEMRHLIDKIGNYSIFSKAGIILMALCIMATAVFGLMDKCPWYVLLIIVIGIAAFFYGLWWLFKDNRNPIDIDIEKLQTLEEEVNS